MSGGYASHCLVLFLIDIFAIMCSDDHVMSCHVVGNKMNQVCSGEAGMCNLEIGKCLCDETTRAVSSNGTSQRGWRGDCGTTRRT